MKPLPPLDRGEFFWEGRDVLPVWAGFQSRLGPYTSIDKPGPSDGAVLLQVDPPGDEAANNPPAHEQLVAYEHLKENASSIARSVLEAVLRYAKGLPEEYGISSDLDAVTLRSIVGLGAVHVLDVARGNFAYIGFEFGCDWDEEHGCGVMTHAGRIVAVGQADESFEGWIAERDGGERLP